MGKYYYWNRTHSKKSCWEAFALTCPLITKADGGKFGKTEQGNIWLDPSKTSPYAFYQFWLNCSDVDTKKYIRIFTLLNQEEIQKMENEHNESPHLRILQKTLARELTIRVHSEEEYNAALNASEILFGKGTAESLVSLPESTFLSVFEGVPQFEVSKDIITSELSIVDFLTDHAAVFASKGEIRRMLKENGLSINKQKIDDTYKITFSSLLNDKYILVQKGKKITI